MDDSTLIITQIKPKQIDIYKQENKLTNLMIINLAKIRFGGSGGGTSPAKPEDFFQETYTANGNYDVAPQAGHVFSGGQIEVDVQPRLQTKEAAPLTHAQIVSPDAGYDGLQSVTVTGVTSEIDSNITADNIKKDVTILGVTGTLESGIIPTGTINISDNGTYDVTDKATAVVAVGGTDYRYKTGTPDTIGLAAIGWDADSIGYYGANAPHYAWENDNYKVSQKNIDLYSLDDPDPSLYKDDPEVTFIPNKNMSTYFGSTSGFQAFNDMKYIKGFPWYDTSKMTRMDRMFNGCSSLQTIPSLDTSSVTNMANMFEGCMSLTSIPALDTSKVTDMQSMFNGCSSLQTIPPLDTSSVKRVEGMFNGCSSLQTIPPLDTSSVTGSSGMNFMFSGCSTLQTIPLLDMSGVITTQYMFQNCSKLTSIPSLDTSSVTNMANMFIGCSSLQTIPSLDVSSVTNMSSTFSDCSRLTSIPPLDTSNVTSVGQIFQNCNSLQSVEGFDFSGVTYNISYLFGFSSSMPKLTHFIVNGKINVTISGYYGFRACTNLDYDSIKSILEAMNRTDNSNAKTMEFNRVIEDHNGELTALVTSCATKGWTITGLNVFEKPLINSITPSIDHIHISDMRPAGSGLTLTIDANYAWKGAGVPKDHLSDSDDIGYQYDFYDANTDELVRTGNYFSRQSGLWSPYTGSEGVTSITGHYGPSDLKNPQSGEYALVGITLKNATSPYLYYDYYFKVYPDGE